MQLQDSKTRTISSESLTIAKRQLTRLLLSPGTGSSRYKYAAVVHRNSLGSPLTFRDCLWLVTIYQDKAQEVIVKKASQVGITELALLLLFHLASKGISGLYILPTDQFRSDFMRERFNPTVEANPLLDSVVGAAPKSADAMSVKMVYSVPWKFVGAKNRRNFFSFPAQAIIADEFDECDQDNMAYAEDRLGRAASRTFYKFGNPSLPRSGIDAAFEAGDRKYWHIKCAGCNHWQQVSWFDMFVRQVDERQYELRDPAFDNSLDFATIDLESPFDARGYCKKCEKNINRLGVGCWVQWHQDRRISSYHVNRLFGDPRPRATILELYYGDRGFLKSLDNFSWLARFFNNVLGECFRAPGSSITADMLERCVRDYRMSLSPPDAELLAKYEGVSAGCDVGKRLHLHISLVDTEGRRRKIFVKAISDFKELGYWSDLFGIDQGVIDCKPETHSVDDFLLAYPNWYKCNYPSAPRMTGEYKVDYVKQYIVAGRTQSLDGSYQDIARQYMELPLDFMTLDDGDFVPQMEAPTRIYDTRRDVYVWDEGSKPDHHRHADNYDRIASKILVGGGPIIEAV